MAFRTARQHRYSLLRESGFLPFESYQMSRVSLKVPYMRPMIAKRRRELERAKDEHWTKAKYNSMIRQEYRAKDWTKKSRGSNIVLDPWKMIKDTEDRYKSKHPEYTSPWERRRRSIVDFMSTYERKIKKQAVR